MDRRRIRRNYGKEDLQDLLFQELDEIKKILIFAILKNQKEPDTHKTFDKWKNSHFSWEEKENQKIYWMENNINNKKEVIDIKSFEVVMDKDFVKDLKEIEEYALQQAKNIEVEDILLIIFKCGFFYLVVDLFSI